MGIDWDIGHSGSARVGAEPFSTVTPALFFGKGFGDLPEDARFLRPFALTGRFGVSIPSRTSTSTINDDGNVVTEQNPNNLIWGFALEYSIPYLQSFVKDMEWGAPFNRMIPIVEFNFSTALNRGASGTTGTINPGILWAGQSVQLGIEAVIPVNARDGEQDRRDCATALLPRRHLPQDDRETALRELTMPHRVPAAFCLAALVAIGSNAHAHAFLDHARSAVGSTVHGPQQAIRIWFTQEIEPAFSTIKVLDSKGNVIAASDKAVDPSDRTLLQLPVRCSRPAPIASCGGCSPSTAT